MTEWQPIETAPFLAHEDSDPSKVLLWVADGGSRGKGEIAFGFCYRTCEGSIRARASGYYGKFNITHWMPLPPPPAQDK